MGVLTGNRYKAGKRLPQNPSRAPAERFIKAGYTMLNQLRKRMSGRNGKWTKRFPDGTIITVNILNGKDYLDIQTPIAASEQPIRVRGIVTVPYNVDKTQNPIFVTYGPPYTVAGVPQNGILGTGYTESSIDGNDRKNHLILEGGAINSVRVTRYPRWREAFQIRNNTPPLIGSHTAGPGSLLGYYGNRLGEGINRARYTFSKSKNGDFWSNMGEHDIYYTVFSGFLGGSSIIPFLSEELYDTNSNKLVHTYGTNPEIATNLYPHPSANTGIFKQDFDISVPNNGLEPAFPTFGRIARELNVDDGNPYGTDIYSRGERIATAPAPIIGMYVSETDMTVVTRTANTIPRISPEIGSDVLTFDTVYRVALSALDPTTTPWVQIAQVDYFNTYGKQVVTLPLSYYTFNNEGTLISGNVLFHENREQTFAEGIYRQGVEPPPSDTVSDTAAQMIPGIIEINITDPGAPVATADFQETAGFDGSFIKTITKLGLTRDYLINTSGTASGSLVVTAPFVNGVKRPVTLSLVASTAETGTAFTPSGGSQTASEDTDGFADCVYTLSFDGGPSINVLERHSVIDNSYDGASGSPTQGVWTNDYTEEIIYRYIVWADIEHMDILVREVKSTRRYQGSRTMVFEYPTVQISKTVEHKVSLYRGLTEQVLHTSTIPIQTINSPTLAARQGNPFFDSETVTFARALGAYGTPPLLQGIPENQINETRISHSNRSNQFVMSHLLGDAASAVTGIYTEGDQLILSGFIGLMEPALRGVNHTSLASYYLETDFGGQSSLSSTLMNGPAFGPEHCVFRWNENYLADAGYVDQTFDIDDGVGGSVTVAEGLLYLWPEPNNDTNLPLLFTDQLINVETDIGIDILTNPLLGQFGII